MVGKPISAKARLFGARVRAGDARAIQRVVSELERRGGNMQATAAALGVSERTLYLWRDSVPELSARIKVAARGRVGRPRKGEKEGTGT